SDRGDYEYGEACEGGSAGPQALSRVGNSRFCYNAAGQLTEGSGKKVRWSAYGIPKEILKGTNAVRFRFSPHGKRIETVSTQKGLTRKTLSLGIYDEITDQDGVVQRHNLPGGLVVTLQNGLESEEYLHTDLLGSIISITGPGGEILERMDFDVWGLRRDINTKNSLSDYQTLTKNRFGFTGQEELDAVDFVHMNGRVYDPTFGRFLSPDPFIQSPDNLQSMNRYSYVWNNPLTNTDPSGYFMKSLSKSFSSSLGGIAGGLGDAFSGIGKAFNRFGDWISKPQNQRLVAAIAISAVGGVGASAALAAYGGFASASVAGIAGFASGYVASNGDTNYALRSALTAVAFNAVGTAFSSGDTIGTGLKHSVLKTAAHGFVGGTSSLMSGGDFISGFATAGVSEGLSSFGAYDQVQSALSVSSSWGAVAYESVAGALVGGTTSELTGGTFENGAMTGAMGRLFNHVAHSMSSTIVQQASWDEVGKVYSKDLCTPGLTMVDPHDGRTAYMVGTVNSPGAGLEPDYTIENVLGVAAVARAGIGLALRGYANSSVMVTSWAPVGEVPTIVPGRWVMVGGPTRTNYILTGLPGPKVYIMEGRYEWAKYSIDNAKSMLVPRSTLRWPAGTEKIKGLLGQRQYHP
ncbi:MAG: hypothetical protein EOP04_13960, partial [Proteobacteria bacterium]